MCSACTGASSQSRQTGQRPTRVEQRVLDVLGDQPGDVRLALGPLLGPPLAVGDGVLERGDRRRCRVLAGLEVGEHPGAGVEQPSRVHVPIMLGAPQASPPGRAVGAPYSAGMGTALLEVTVLGPRDVAGADEGGADRLHLVGEGGLSPEPSLVSATCRETELPVFVVLRLNDSWTTTGGELTRLVGLAEDYLSLRRDRRRRSASSTPTSRSTPRSASTSPAALPEVPWTLPPGGRRHARPAPLVATAARRCPAWSRSSSAGSPRGLSVGYDDLLDTAESDPRIAALLMPAGGLLGRARAVVRAGRRPAVPPRARRRGRGRRTSPTSTPGHVRSWRLLLDSAVERSAGSVAG